VLREIDVKCSAKRLVLRELGYEREKLAEMRRLLRGKVKGKPAAPV
jgi:hypothetical protein